MNSSFILLLVVGSILLPSLGGVYFTLRSVGWPGGRLGKDSIFIWLAWIFVVSFLYVPYFIIAGPLRSMSDVVVEFGYLMFVGTCGLLSVLLATRFLWRRVSDQSTLSDGCLESVALKPAADLQTSFLISLAATISLLAAIGLNVVVDDIYYNRFSGSEPIPGFTIYD